MRILNYTKNPSRSAPGLVVTFTVSGPVVVQSIELDLVDDGEAGVLVNFGPQTDGRTVGRLGFLPARKGRFPLVLRATDVRGCQAHTDGSVFVNVQ